jgi:hypothetical protein
MLFGYRKDKPEIKNTILSSILSRCEEILYFAAATNFGVKKPEMFLARFRHVIFMCGSNANGFFPDFNPLPRKDKGIVYSTLGIKVLKALIRPDKRQEPRLGLSITTAVAAGIAAVLLKYITWKKQQGRDPEILRKLKT